MPATSWRRCRKSGPAPPVSDSNAKVAALRITLARLHAEVYGTPLAFPEDLHGYQDYMRNQRDLYQKRRTAIKEDLAALGNMLSLARQELSINRKLVATGDVSQAEILRLQRAVADIEAQMTSRRNKYFQDAQAEMTKAQEDLTSQTEQLRDRNQVLEQTRLVATADGIVNNIRVNTIGAWCARARRSWRSCPPAATCWPRRGSAPPTSPSSRWARAPMCASTPMTPPSSASCRAR